MDTLDVIALGVFLGGFAVAVLVTQLELRKARHAADEATARLAQAEQRCADARTEIERADAVAAKLWLFIEPNMSHIYNRAVSIFGKPEVDRNMREAVESGTFKLPDWSN